jgi:electron transport complex protein RnfC
LQQNAPVSASVSDSDVDSAQNNGDAETVDPKKAAVAAAIERAKARKAQSQQNAPVSASVSDSDVDSAQNNGDAETVDPKKAAVAAAIARAKARKAQQTAEKTDIEGKA